MKQDLTKQKIKVATYQSENAEKLPCQRRAAEAAQAFGGCFTSVCQIGGLTDRFYEISPQTWFGA